MLRSLIDQPSFVTVEFIDAVTWERLRFALLGSVGRDAIGALALPEKFSRGGIKPLPQRFEIIGRDLP